ncbi:MAG: type IV secretion system DNA-binding domain-containing protein [Lachnospiraceae bacterium]|nr:type IV secretion system DNA-binding domain-containing protein [Lachnospiraceae bacterium]
MSFNYGNSLFDNTMNRNRNSGIYVRTLFGQSIHDNPVPIWTANKENNPFVAFQDPITGNTIGLNKDILSYGYLALGAPGTGKTNLFNMILSRLLATQKENDVIIIFDTKGDYLEEFGNKIPEMDKVIIGAGEEYRSITGYHNIFEEIMPKAKDRKLVYTYDCDIDALDVSSQLFQKMNSDVQPVFPAMSEQIFAGILIFFMRTYWRGKQEKLNNKDLVSFFTSKTNEDLKKVFELEYMEDQRSCIDYINNKSNQTQGVNSYIGSVLKKMFIGPFAETDWSREFSMKSIIESNEKKVVFIEYDLKRGHALAPMYGVMIDRALANALGGRQNERKNVFILLDEMLLLPKLNHLSNSLNFGRSRGVKILAGLQNVSGVIDLYGEAGAKNIIASFQNMITFKITDYDTRQFVRNSLGENYQNYSFSTQKDLNIQRAGYTVEDWDLYNLGFGEAIVSIKGEKPFFFKMPEYK